MAAEEVSSWCCSALWCREWQCSLCSPWAQKPRLQQLLRIQQDMQARWKSDKLFEADAPAEGELLGLATCAPSQLLSAASRRGGGQVLRHVPIPLHERPPAPGARLLAEQGAPSVGAPLLTSADRHRRATPACSWNLRPPTTACAGAKCSSLRASTARACPFRCAAESLPWPL